MSDPAKTLFLPAVSFAWGVTAFPLSLLAFLWVLIGPYSGLGLLFGLFVRRRGYESGLLTVGLTLCATALVLSMFFGLGYSLLERQE